LIKKSNDSTTSSASTPELPRLFGVFRWREGNRGSLRPSRQGGFEIWNDYAVFEKVRIGNHREIKWNNDLELCGDTLYLKLTGKTPEELFEIMNGS